MTWRRWRAHRSTGWRFPFGEATRVRAKGEKRRGFRRAVKRVGEGLVEAVGEAVAEVILGLLACVLLGCLVLIAHLGWSFSPRLTLAGAGLFSLLLAHGAWRTFRTAAKGRRRGFAAFTAGIFTVTAVTALLLLFYATGCDCL
ncbi:hypothetical protein EK410_22930 [Streptomyces sp. CAI-17]|nr:hypothetical protein [Streptomyces sp. CAI-17]